jgi:hypothetical protein
MYRKISVLKGKLISPAAGEKNAPAENRDFNRRLPPRFVAVARPMVSQGASLNTSTPLRLML